MKYPTEKVQWIGSRTFLEDGRTSVQQTRSYSAFAQGVRGRIATNILTVAGPKRTQPDQDKMPMSKRVKLKWKDLHVLRKILRYTQEKWGRLLGMSQSAVSLQETKHADDYVDPELVRKAVEGSIGAPKAPEQDHVLSDFPTRIEGTWRIVFASEPLPPNAWLAEAQLVAGGDPQRRIFMANFEGTPPPTQGGVGLVTSMAGSSSSGSQALSSRFMAGFALAACLACCTLVTGCLLSHRPPDEPLAQEPLRPERLCTDNATNNAAMGTQPKHSIKMPDKPYSWQKVAPCDSGESEERGGCWERLADDRRPPCPEIAVENEAGKCLVPVPAQPKKPNTVEPTK